LYGLCRVLPVKVPDKYNQDLSLNKAIHIYFSQAVPLVTYIDPESCLYLQGEKCSICRGVCKNKAIDLHQEEETLTVEVGRSFWLRATRSLTRR